MRTVGDVAQLLGISVRTLHYWEERGLVVPERTWSDYRLYSDTDIARLQQVMAYRATGMSLDAIRDLLAGPGTGVDHLRRQRQLLMEKQGELTRMIDALDYLLEDAMNNHELSVDEVAAILGEANFPAYQAEAEEAYGETSDWEISAKRQARMTKADWERVARCQHDVETRLAQAMQAGVVPGSEEANALAEEHRALLSEAFFPVTHAKHVILGRGYVADRRFRAHYDDVAPGLTHWLHQVIDANAAAHGVDLERVEWV